MWWGSTRWSNVATNHWGARAAPRLCLFWIFPNDFVTWRTQELAENDLGPSLFCRCRPCDEFSLWWRFVGDTLNPLGAKSLQSCLFPPEAFDQQLVFAPLSSSACNYTLLFLWTLQLCVPLCCCIHTAVSLLSPCEVKTLILTSQEQPGFCPSCVTAPSRSLNNTWICPFLNYWR